MCKGNYNIKANEDLVFDEEEILIPLKPSLFHNVPPSINFVDPARKPVNMPKEISKHMIFKSTSRMSKIIKDLCFQAGYRTTKEKNCSRCQGEMVDGNYAFTHGKRIRVREPMKMSTIPGKLIHEADPQREWEGITIFSLLSVRPSFHPIPLFRKSHRTKHL